MQDLADPTFIHDKADKNMPHEISGSELKDINRGRRFLEVRMRAARSLRVATGPTLSHVARP